MPAPATSATPTLLAWLLSRGGIIIVLGTRSRRKQVGEDQGLTTVHGVPLADPVLGSLPAERRAVAEGGWLGSDVQPVEEMVAVEGRNTWQWAAAAEHQGPGSERRPAPPRSD